MIYPRTSTRHRQWLLISTSALVCASTILSGCISRPVTSPRQDIPIAFEGATAPGEQWPAEEWYGDFASDELNAFIALAVRNNTDLDAARARVAQADARARQAGSAILPTIQGNAGGNYLAGHSSQGSGHELDWSAMLSASYEVDFWGKNRATADSARFLAGASRAERDAVALTTLAGVADGYFQLLALRERLSVAQSNRDTAHQVLDAVTARFEAAVATPVDVATQKAAFDMAQIAISDLQQMEGEARTALAILLGQPPEHFEVKGQPLDSLGEPRIGAGLPSELLTRRPDVLLAESKLRAGHADLVAARAAMFPSLSLTAGGGVQNPALNAAVLSIPGVGPSLTLGADLVQPIFDRGRLKAQRDEVQAKDLELLAAYRASIVAALGDVENALGALQHLNEARQYQIENVAQSERALEGARLRYQAGSTDFLTLLEAQRTLYLARDQFIQYKLARLQALVALCKALGGGWTSQQAHLPASGTATGGLS